MSTDRRYVTARRRPTGMQTRVSHIIAFTYDSLPGAYQTACGHFARGIESTERTERLCPRCDQAVGARPPWARYMGLTG
jgi:hypothetical protein